jgi:hypothetical protein
MKKILVILIVVLFCKEGFGQQMRTLGGLGAGGLNGNGFGDPIANDYAGIDWGYDFQTGMIINGYSPKAAKLYANRMRGVNAARNRRYDEAFNPKKKAKKDFVDQLQSDIESVYPWMKNIK